MVLSRVIPLAVVLSTISCTRAEVFRIDNAIRPQTHPDSVLFLAQEPTRPYTVIALLNVTSADGSQEQVRKRFLKEAALLGGDAVLLGIGSLSYVTTGSGEYSSSARLLSGKVIVFRREGEAAN
jgi:hypothetical protein